MNTKREYGAKLAYVLQKAQEGPITRNDFDWDQTSTAALLNYMSRKGYIRVVERGDIGRHTKDSKCTKYELAH